MDKFHLYWFTDEIELHTSIALASYEKLEVLVSDPDSLQNREVWYALFSFLTHAAMVSKVFKPISADRQERGLALREYLALAEDSPILARSARDNLEHIDERIDGWVERNESRVIEMVFDDRDGYEYILERDGAVRRVLIRSEMVFVSENRIGERLETDLLSIMEELAGLKLRCLQRLTNDSPYTLIAGRQSNGR